MKPQIKTALKYTAGLATFAAVKFSPFYIPAMETVVNAVVAAGPFVMGTATALTLTAAVKWASSGEKAKEKQPEKLFNFNYEKHIANLIVKISSPIKLISGLISKILFNPFKTAKKIDDLTNFKSNEVKPVKKQVKKVKYESLGDTEIEHFKERLDRIIEAPTQKLTGSSLNQIENLKEHMRDTQYSLNEKTVDELRDKNGVIRAVRMVNKLKNTQDVVDFSNDKKKLKEISELVVAVENRKERKLKLMNLQNYSIALDKELEIANREGLTLKEYRNSLKTEDIKPEEFNFETEAVKAEKVKVNIKRQSKATVKPALRK